MANKLTSKEIVDMNKEYTFFSWSIQGQVNPIPVVKSEGVYFWDADGKRYLDFASQLVNREYRAPTSQSGESHSRSSCHLDLCHPRHGNRTARIAWQKTCRDHARRFEENLLCIRRRGSE